jgi:hypothetical protein
MFEYSQKQVTGAQVARFGFGHRSEFGEYSGCAKRVFSARPGMLRADHHLQLLHDPFGVADRARPLLDVARIAAFRSTLATPFHLHDFLKMRIVRSLCPCDRAREATEAARQLRIARDGSRFNQGLPFPRTGVTFVIRKRIIERGNERPRRAFGPQPHVYAVEYSFGAGIRQRFENSLP